MFVLFFRYFFERNRSGSNRHTHTPNPRIFLGCVVFLFIFPPLPLSFSFLFAHPFRPCVLFFLRFVFRLVPLSSARASDLFGRWTTRCLVFCFRIVLTFSRNAAPCSHGRLPDVFRPPPRPSEGQGEGSRAEGWSPPCLMLLFVPCIWFRVTGTQAHRAQSLLFGGGALFGLPLNTHTFSPQFFFCYVYMYLCMYVWGTLCSFDWIC